MTRDLEETLAELGPGYREVVERLTGGRNDRGAEAGFAGRGGSSAGGRHRRVAVWTVGYLAAASLVVFLGVSAIFSRGPAARGGAAVYTAAYARDEAALAAIVASQRSDGSWSNDFLTMQNAAALRSARDDTGRVAYKKALRYLRAKGLRPLTDEELRSRGDRAADLWYNISL